MSKLIKMEDIDLLSIGGLPFQAQIEYTDLTGATYMRVITKKLDISTDKTKQQANANYDLMNRNVIQNTAKLASNGDVKEA